MDKHRSKEDSDWSEVTYLWWEADVIKLFETVWGDHKDKWAPKEKVVSLAISLPGKAMDIV